MHLRASDLASAVGGRLVGPDVVVDGATNDSRAVLPGQLFVPIVAERDGHAFIGAALAAGASAYLTSVGAGSGSAIEVDDTAAALTAAGRFARDLLPDRVVGVTGSVGKTSVKDLLAVVLATRWPTAASARSFNNELGVPLTLLGAPDGTEAVVVEMGARSVGHVAELCRVARPTVGIVTRVAPAHLEVFGTIEDVAVAKGELIEALPADGTAVLNADDPRVAAMAGRGPAAVVTFGEQGEVRAERVVLDDHLVASFRLVSPWGALDEVRLAVRGRHQVDNALAAAAAALSQGVPVESVAEGLGAARLSPWRMELGTAPGGALVLNDAYNANPASMEAALRALAELPASRRTAVLGPMAELGATGRAEHRAVAELARGLGIEVLGFATADYGAPVVFTSCQEAARRLAHLGPGDAVLVKGSRVAGLERLAELLLRAGQA